MTEMVERVARALAREDDIDPDVFIGMHGRAVWQDQWHARARAAIVEMREPTIWMILSCAELPCSQQDVWKRSIDAALEEPR